VHIPDIHAEWGSRTLKEVCYRAYPGSAMCVQNLDDSRGLAIRITYRISLRSSSLWEPRHPLLKVVQTSIFILWMGIDQASHTPCLRFNIECGIHSSEYLPFGFSSCALSSLVKFLVVLICH
jgi:hypothetical protein